jgi:hypothetical protein
MRNNHIFGPIFSFAVMRAQCNDGGGRILLGDNKVGGAVMLRAMRFQYVGVGISTGLTFIFQNSWPYVYRTGCYTKFGARRNFRNVTDGQGPVPVAARSKS